MDAAWLQVPAPLQVDAGCSVDPLHERARPHDTDAAACVQAPAPLQVPVLPHGGLAVHWPAGAAVPAASGVQVPGVPPLQVLQVPQLVLPAGMPQQTVLMQLPLMHSLPAAQAAPFAFSAQLRLGGVPWQVNGVRHCESIEQVVRQVVPPQVYGVQLDAVGGRQLPLPSQWEVGV